MQWVPLVFFSCCKDSLNHCTLVLKHGGQGCLPLLSMLSSQSKHAMGMPSGGWRPCPPTFQTFPKTSVEVRSQQGAATSMLSELPQRIPPVLWQPPEARRWCRLLWGSARSTLLSWRYQYQKPNDHQSAVPATRLVSEWWCSHRRRSSALGLIKFIAKLGNYNQISGFSHHHKLNTMVARLHQECKKKMYWGGGTQICGPKIRLSN